jgi:hypothetical protein
MDKRIIIFFILILVMNFSAPGQELKKDYSGLGTVIITSFNNSPFPHPQRCLGIEAEGRFFTYEGHYDDSTVLIFIPENFKADKKLDVVFYFHGWWNSIYSSINQFEIIEQFAESKKNAILVLTETAKNATDNFGGKFADDYGFKRFIFELLDYLNLQEIAELDGIGKIVLMGHSGAYRIISNIIERGGLNENIKEVYLFDALYGQSEVFFNWIKTNNENINRFISIYTQGGGTINENVWLLDSLKANEIYFTSDYEKNITNKILEKKKLIFIYSDSDHNGVLTKGRNIKRYLSTSYLKDIKKKK